MRVVSGPVIQSSYCLPFSIFIFHLKLTIIHVVLYDPSSLYYPLASNNTIPSQPITIYMAQPFFQHRPILPYHPLLPINHRDLHLLNELPQGRSVFDSQLRRPSSPRLSRPRDETLHHTLLTKKSQRTPCILQCWIGK